jgi:lipoyl-dependent peroxiredoxin
MAIRTVDAEWHGNLAQGSGRMQLESGACEGSYDFRSRMDEGKHEAGEMLGAAHAGCFSMALQLTNAGCQTQRMPISKSVPAGGPSTDSKSRNGSVDLECHSNGLQEYAQNAERNCTVSRALSGVDIHLRAKLL